MTLETASTSNTEDVPLPLLIEAVIDIYEEWEMVENNRTELPEAEATAYQEGLLTALRHINSTTDISIETMEPEARQRVGLERRDRGNQMECDSCGREKIFEMGSEDPICPTCETG